MQRDKEYLLDNQEAAKLALTYIANKTKEDFLKDIQYLLSTLNIFFNKG